MSKSDGLLSEAEIMAQASTVKPDAPKMDELDALFPSPKVYLINGESIVIHEFTFGELPKALKLLKIVGGLFMHYLQADALNSPEALMHILTEGGEDLIELLAFNVGKPRSWFDTVPADEGIALLLDFCKDNISFFSNRVIPALKVMSK